MVIFSRDRSYSRLTAHVTSLTSPYVPDTLQAFEFFSDHLGMKYPYKSYKQVRACVYLYEYIPHHYSPPRISQMAFLHPKSLVD